MTATTPSSSCSASLSEKASRQLPTTEFRVLLNVRFNRNSSDKSFPQSSAELSHSYKSHDVGILIIYSNTKWILTNIVVDGIHIWRVFPKEVPWTRRLSRSKGKW